jgi:hypothetical protein
MDVARARDSDANTVNAGREPQSRRRSFPLIPLLYPVPY